MLDERDADHAVQVLNELFRLDPKPMAELVASRVNCGTEWADHPTCQVSTSTEPVGDPVGRVGVYSVGMIGVLNAIFGADEDSNGFIAAKYDTDGKLIGFCRFMK